MAGGRGALHTGRSFEWIPRLSSLNLLLLHSAHTFCSITGQCITFKSTEGAGAFAQDTIAVAGWVSLYTHAL